MGKIYNFSSTLLNLCLVLFFRSLAGPAVAEDDVKCLRGVRHTLRDPEDRLSNWNDQENRVLTLQLGIMNLFGSVSSSLQYCRSLQNLDLADNALSGTIPSEICTWLPYWVMLDLSNNDLSGPIPPELSKCAFLNRLVLDGNRLSDAIPYEFSSLGRLS